MCHSSSPHLPLLLLPTPPQAEHDSETSDAGCRSRQQAGGRVRARTQITQDASHHSAGEATQEGTQRREDRQGSTEEEEDSK